MVRNGQFYGDVCTVCGGNKKACYRRNFNSVYREGFVYAILPCHGCNRQMFKTHPLSHPYWELSDEWREQNELAATLTARERAIAEERRINEVQRVAAMHAAEEEVERRIREINNVRPDSF